LFSGEYWTGNKALELGLVDRLGDLRSSLRERFGEKVRTPLIAEKGWLGRRLPGVGQRFDLPTSASFADDVISTLEARAIWARYGL
jgi:ClpP class serine protease